MREHRLVPLPHEVGTQVTLAAKPVTSATKLFHARALALWLHTCG